MKYIVLAAAVAATLWVCLASVDETDTSVPSVAAGPVSAGPLSPGTNVHDHPAASPAPGRHKAHLPVARPAPHVPTSATSTPVVVGSIAERVMRASTAMGPTAAEDYRALINALRQDRSASTAALVDALRARGADDRNTLDERMEIYTLGELAHADAIPMLQEIALRPDPQGGAHTHHYNAVDQSARTRSVAIGALEKVAERYADPERVTALRDTLDTLIDDPDTDVRLQAAAVTIARRHSRDPEAAALALEARLSSERAPLAHLQLTDSIPDSLQ